MVDFFDLTSLRSSLGQNTKLVWLEVCSNPHNMVLDIKAVVSVVKDFNKDIIVGVDNTFLSPWVLVLTHLVFPRAFFT